MLGSELKEFGIYTTIFLVFIFILFALFSPSPPLFRFIILLAHPWYEKQTSTDSDWLLREDMCEDSASEQTRPRDRRATEGACEKSR